MNVAPRKLWEISPDERVAAQKAGQEEAGLEPPYEIIERAEIFEVMIGQWGEFREYMEAYDVED